MNPMMANMPSILIISPWGLTAVPGGGGDEAIANRASNELNVIASKSVEPPNLGMEPPLASFRFNFFSPVDRPARDPYPPNLDEGSGSCRSPLQQPTRPGPSPAVLPRLIGAWCSNVVGQPGTTTFTDTNAVGASPFFYRVGVEE